MFKGKVMTNISPHVILIKRFCVTMMTSLNGHGKGIYNLLQPIVVVVGLTKWCDGKIKRYGLC
jgi:hypothetical protein